VKQHGFTLLKIAVTLGLLVLVFNRVAAQQVGEALRGANLALVVLAIVIYFAAIATNAAKWGVLLRAQGTPFEFGTVLRLTFVGVFFNIFLPMVASDVVRGYGLARDTKRGADSAVSVMMDRLVGMFVFTGMGTLAALIALQWNPADALVAIAVVGVLLLLGLLTAFAFLLSDRVRRWVVSVFRRLPVLRASVPVVLRLSETVGMYRARPAALLAAGGIGIVTLLLSNLVNWLLFLAIGIAMPPLYVFVLNPIVGMSMNLPLSFSGIGVNQNVYPLLYGIVGVAAVPAVAVSLLMQVTIWLTSLPGGLLWAADRSRARSTALQVPVGNPATEQS
jgi:uncharacterized protein (TIRG00374 family)